ncbi:hypothetical protein Ccrd_019230 [Cynara cardunculus var. scolymus]|uniref:Uncharacterized protein n=1 Tax=Cynara cardunculus var. scolymus TaxID=59895 RepID=A0A103Y4N8_CYNCS|nr:hypothetical protein Ccrd_019230 [Cynara cardunculus var. scolymus]
MKGSFRYGISLKVSESPSSMELLLAGDTTSLSYWLNWKFLLCIIWVLTPMIIASYLIWKYEGLGDSNSYKEETQQEKEWSLYDHEAWTPCVKAIHPVWLLVFRIISFCLLLSASISDVFGSLLSAYGCFRQHKTSDVGEEQDFLLPLTHEENISRKSHFLQTAAFWGYIFQIVFQTVAGAAILTDIVYWTVFVPFLTIKGYEMGFLTVLAHSLNLVLLLGDTALNSLVAVPISRLIYGICSIVHLLFGCETQTLHIVSMVSSIVSMFEMTFSWERTRSTSRSWPSFYSLNSR